MSFNVFSANDQGWSDALSRIPKENSDINFLPEWYKTWEAYEKATAQCIVAEIEGFIFVYPFLISPIEGYNTDKTYFDIQTAYGYGGVITSAKTIPATISSLFNKKVDEWLIENNVVAEFIREHPLLNYFRRDADYMLVRQNVYVPLSQDYRIPDSKTRQKISKAVRNNELRILIDNKLEFMNKFVYLYNLNARRIGMSDYYLFPDDYFNKVKTLLSENTELIHVLYENKIINSVLCFKSGNKGTLHLAGANHEYQALKANDFMYYSAIKHYADLGLDILAIGGGLTSREDDSLFHFKKKFSDLHMDVMIGKRILNQPVYTNLIDQWKSRYPELEPINRNFFLKYRQKPD